MRSIVWISEKGGCAKSTSAINTAAGLARLGRRVLLVDCDPQGNASLVLLGGQAPEPPTLAAVLMGDAEAAEAIRPTEVVGLDILPADVSLAEAALALGNVIGRECRLRSALEPVAAGYDVVMLDTSPARSLLTVNALTFAREVLVPVEPGLFSLSGLGSLQTAVDDVRRYLGNRELRIAGLALVRTRNDSVSRDVAAKLREAFGELVFRTTVPSNVRIEEAHSRYQPVIDFAPKSPGAVAYLNLTREIIAHGQQTGTGEPAGGPDPTDHESDAGRGDGRGRSGRRAG